MDDTTRTRTGTQAGPMLIGFALGAAVGAGLALLFAPASGERTRARLAQGARETGELVADAIGRARSTAGEAVKHARTATTELSEDVVAAVQAGRAAYVSERQDP